MFIRFFVVVSLLASYSALAINITGEGYGTTRSEAKKQALASLSEALQVEVKSETVIFTNSKLGTEANTKIQALSELPLLGVDFTCINKGNEFFCSSFLNTLKAKPLYTEKLSLLDQSFTVMYRQLRQSKATDNYQLLTDMLVKREQFEKYLLVSRLIGVKNIPALPMQSSQIKAEMLSIESAVPSLDLAARLLTRGLPDERMFVYAAMPQGSQEATQLSRVLRDKVMRHVKTFEQRKQAAYVMKGHYEPHNDGILLTYRLVTDSGETLATRVVMLDKSAYKNISHQSKSVDFSKLLHEGYVVSNNFHAEINTNRGKTDLLFTENEEIELFVRVNRPGYFYIVAHNSTDNSSYLMELSESAGKRRFVQYVNADQANRWISLGAFEVGAPYGVENLQLIAATKDLIDKLPSHRFDNENEIYILSENTIKKAVTATRALKPKKKQGKVQSAEATLSFTTMK